MRSCANARRRRANSIPPKLRHGKAASQDPPIAAAAAPIVVVILVNLVLSLGILPRLDLSFLSEPRWGGITPAGVTGVWSVMAALSCAIVAVLAINLRRIPDLRVTMDAGVNASALPAISVASLVGFGAVVAAMPAFEVVRDAVLGIGGGPLVSLAVATNILAALTGSASGGLTIALDALGSTYLERAAQIGMDPALLHRVAVIGAGTLDSLPHNGAVVTLLAVCGSTHGESYRDIFMVAHHRRDCRARRRHRARIPPGLILGPRHPLRRRRPFKRRLLAVASDIPEMC